MEYKNDIHTYHSANLNETINHSFSLGTKLGSDAGNIKVMIGDTECVNVTIIKNDTSFTCVLGE